MPLTPQQEQEIYPILDKVSDLPLGKGVLHRCTPQRAGYLSRMIRGLRYDTAIESLQMYKPGEPLYGLGLYAYIWAEPHEQGLLATKLDQPFNNVMWQLITCAATRDRVILPEGSYIQARQYLQRVQKKYPDIMNHVFIEAGDPPIANFAAGEGEELLIVDIDIRPGTKLRAPTDTDIAKAGLPMQLPRNKNQ